MVLFQVRSCAFVDRILGSPLTLLVLGLPYYAREYLDHNHDWFWIPLADLLFVLQWIIWSQLIKQPLTEGD
jgi:hypothetical protein